MTDEFIQYVYETRCEFQIEADRVATSDIEAGIRTIINDILESIKDTTPTFEVSDVIPTGSFYEGTKIGAPDEFDFMILLKKLTGPDKINLHRGCSDWYPKIELQKGVTFSQRYMVNIRFNDEKRHENFLGSSRILVLFFWREIRELLKRKTFSIDTSRGTISSEHHPGDKLVFFHRHKVDKSLPKPANEVEAKLAMVVVESLYIGVDLMIAIEHPCLEYILHFPGFPKDFKELLFEHKCHIVAKSCHKDHTGDPACWFISFSSMERELVNSMNEHHKKCYKILKSLIACDLSVSGKCMNLSSYLLKTAFLFHVYGEPKCLHSRTLFACIKDVLNYLSTNLFCIRMPCFFARDMNTWGHILETPCYTWEKCRTVQYSTHQAESESLEDLPHPVEICWIKLMYKFINFLNVSIAKGAQQTQNDWDEVIFNCTYFKEAVSRLMKLHSDRSEKDVFRLEGDLGTLASCTDDYFYDYLKNLEKHFSLKLYFLMQ